MTEFEDRKDAKRPDEEVEAQIGKEAEESKPADGETQAGRRAFIKGTAAAIGVAAAGVLAGRRYVKPLISTLSPPAHAAGGDPNATGLPRSRSEVTDEQLQRLGLTREQFESLSQEDMDALRGCWCSCQTGCTSGHCETVCTNGNQR